MRLLHTQTLKLTDFIGNDVPRYAILSHTWVTNEEISLQDLEASQKRPTLSDSHPYMQKSGYKKIEQCCRQAQSDGLDWLWIDTCCIDKSSSAELSEAINSMFNWYSRSCVCYTLLSDVSADDDISQAGSEFRRCRWLTRGWTLQEMLAPQEMIFYSQEWTALGTRHDLSDVLSEVTRIPSRYLHRNSDPISEASIAQRMSWAAPRSTTRSEDTAYCLLGIFNVNMPLLYGEGTKAFMRLQEEIIRQTEDQTIFAWGYGTFTPNWTFADSSNHGKRGPHHSGHPYLAQSPSDFAQCNDMVIDKSWNRRYFRDFEITNRGLRITIPLVPGLWQDRRSNCCVPLFGVLDCRLSGDMFNLIIIPLSRPHLRDRESVMNIIGPPQLWPKRFMQWPVFKTFYINTPDVVDDKEDSVHLLRRSESVVVPREPGFSVEPLASDDEIAVEAVRGADYFLLTERRGHERIPVTGRAYIHFQQTMANSSYGPMSFLVLVVFNEEEYPQDRKEAIVRYGTFWKLYRYLTHPYRQITHGSRTIIRCFIAKQPELGGKDLKDRQILQQLSWKPYLDLQDIRLAPHIVNERVGGYDRGVLVMTPLRTPDMGIFSRIIFTPVLQLTFAWRRWILLAVLTFGAAIAAVVSVAHRSLVVGGVWLSLAVNLAVICIGQPRPEFDWGSSWPGGLLDALMLLLAPLPPFIIYKLIGPLMNSILRILGH